MSRKAFNWSLLDRATLYSMLYKLKSELVGKRLPIEQITSILSKHIKSHLPVRVTSSRHKEAKNGEIWVGGLYDSDRDRKGYTRFIEVQLAYPEKIQTLKLSEYRWARVCTVFADMILHEVIHCRQFRARSFKAIPMYQSTAYYAKDRKEQEYYGDRDEMGAHSFNIAQDMLDKFGWAPTEIRYYLDNTPKRKCRPQGWQRFLKAFDWDHDHPKVRQMKRKIMNQLEYAHIGKPFKTNDHLTY